MTASPHIDTWARRRASPARAMAGAPLRPAGVSISRTAQRGHGAARRCAGRGTWRAHRAAPRGSSAELCRSGRADRCNRRLAGARAWRAARRPRASARREHARTIRGVAGSRKNRRDRGADHAAAPTPRAGDGVAARTPGGGAVRAGAGGRTRGGARGHGGGRAMPDRATPSARRHPCPARRRAHPRGRHLPDRLHLGHNGRTQGVPALPPRRAGDVRRVRAPQPRPHPRCGFHRHAAHCVHLRAWRAAGFSAALPRCRRAAGGLGTGCAGADDRAPPRQPRVHVAHRLPRNARADACARSLEPDRIGVGGRASERGDVAGVARRDGAADDRRHRLDRDDPHLPVLDRGRCAPRLGRQAGAGL